MANQPITRNEFGWAESDLRAQYDLAKERGWLDHFKLASDTYLIMVEELLAVSSRESGSLWRKFPDGNVVGDSGKAWGIFQINSNSNKQGAHTVENNILTGAKILADFKIALSKRKLDADALVKTELWYSSYNRGPSGAYLGYLKNNRDASFVTAHGNYGKDCIERAKVFKKFIEQGD